MTRSGKAPEFTNKSERPRLRLGRPRRPEDVGAAVRALDESGISGRVAGCVVFASRGSTQSLEGWIRTAKVDYRDAILEGEYERGERVRDLRVSFLIDGIDNYWAAEVARTMASRGYTLASMETRRATSGPFRCAADAAEGTARFVGPKGEVRVEKKDRRWTLHGDPRELEGHGLDRPFDDESAFREAVSSYLPEAR